MRENKHIYFSPKSHQMMPLFRMRDHAEQVNKRQMKKRRWNISGEGGERSLALILKTYGNHPLKLTGSSFTLLTPPALFSLTWLHIGSDNYIQLRDDFLIYKPQAILSLHLPKKSNPGLHWWSTQAAPLKGLDLHWPQHRSKWIMLSDVKQVLLHCYSFLSNYI